MAGKLPNPPKEPDSPENQEYFEPRSPAEKRFWDKHKVQVTPLPDNYKFPDPVTDKDGKRPADRTQADQQGELGESKLVTEMKARLKRLKEGTGQGFRSLRDVNEGDVVRFPGKRPQGDSTHEVADIHNWEVGEAGGHSDPYEIRYHPDHPGHVLYLDGDDDGDWNHHIENEGYQDVAHGVGASSLHRHLERFHSGIREDAPAKPRRSLSPAQKQKRDKILAGIRNNSADFKKRYGARWEQVAMATATKRALKEGEVVAFPTPSRVFHVIKHDETSETGNGGDVVGTHPSLGVAKQHAEHLNAHGDDYHFVAEADGKPEGNLPFTNVRTFHEPIHGTPDWHVTQATDLHPVNDADVILDGKLINSALWHHKHAQYESYVVEDGGMQAASDSSSGSGYSQSIHNQAPLPTQADGEAEPNDKGQNTGSMNSKQLLEALAILAAEIFDALPKKTELPGDMKQQLGQAFAIVEKVAGFVQQDEDGGGDNERTAAQDTQPGAGATDPQGKLSEAYDKSAADRSRVMRRDKKKHGHAFDSIAKKAADKYGSKAAGARVAGAIMWKAAEAHRK